MSGIRIEGDPSGVKIQQQGTVGNVHVVVLELPNGNLVKVQVIGVEASAQVLNAKGERIWE